MKCAHAPELFQYGRRIGKKVFCVLQNVLKDYFKTLVF